MQPLLLTKTPTHGLNGDDMDAVYVITLVRRFTNEVVQVRPMTKEEVRFSIQTNWIRIQMYNRVLEVRKEGLLIYSSVL